MFTSRNLFLNFIAVMVLGLATACSSSSSSSSSSYDTSSAAIVGSSVAGAASSSDDSTGSVVAGFSPASERSSYLEFLIPKANAATCIVGARVVGLSCTSSAMSLNLNSCTAGGATWTGSDTLTFSSAGACTSAVTGGVLGIGANNSVTLSSPVGITRTGILTGAYVTTDSSASGYNAQVSGGTQMTCGAVDCTTGRTVNILGLHRAEYLASGTKLYDHSISTTAPLTITGSGVNRQITAGTIQLQHNLLKYTASAQVSSALTFSSGCCFPTGGSIITTFSSGRTGSETIAFTSTCGAATVGGSAFTLTHCQ